MKTIFIGGSRRISRLLLEVQERIDNIISGGHQVLVGDANGADTAVQKHLIERGYRNVTVFFSGDRPRNNVGQWRNHAVATEKTAKAYDFYAAKDREMSLRADFGLMVWNGKSPGTPLNLVRMIEQGKIAVLFHFPHKEFLNFKKPDQLRALLKDIEPSVW